MRIPHIFWALIRKDARHLSGFMVLLLLLLSAASFWNSVCIGIRNLLYSTDAPFSELAALMVQGGPFMFAAILAIALNLEWNTKSRFLQLLAPAPSKYFLFSTTAFVVFSGLFISIITLWIGHMPWESAKFWVIHHVFQFDDKFLKQYGLLHLNYGTRHYTIEYYFSILWRHEFWRAVMQNMMSIFLYCGMVCLAQGITIGMKRYRFIIWTISLLAAIFLHAYLRSWLTPDIPFQTQEYIFAHSTGANVFSWLSGYVFLKSGLFLFNRFAEA